MLSLILAQVKAKKTGATYYEPKTGYKEQKEGFVTLSEWPKGDEAFVIRDRTPEKDSNGHYGMTSRVSSVSNVKYLFGGTVKESGGHLDVPDTLCPVWKEIQTPLYGGLGIGVKGGKVGTRYVTGACN